MSRQDAFYLFGFERDYYGAYTYYLISLKIPTSGVQCSIVVYMEPLYINNSYIQFVGKKTDSNLIRRKIRVK